LERYFVVTGVEPNAKSSMWPTAEITDPVAGFWYVLEQEKKIAHRGRIPAVTAPPQQNGLSPEAANFEDLGSEMIDGVVADGRRTTSTVPVGAQGNDHPIVTTIETWTSPELQITMLRKVHDPRNGDTTTELRNFSREEPEATVFTTPQDHRIVDETMPFTINWGASPSSATPGPDGVYRIGGGVSAPVPTFQTQPQYTEEARRAKISGTVVLSLVVGDDGKPRDIKVIQSLGYGLDEKAIEAVEKWTFRPSQKDGKPVPVVATVQVFFRLLDRP
jgi:TonB family protein